MLANWQKEWAAAIAELPLDAAESPSEANIVLDLIAQLSQQLRETLEGSDGESMKSINMPSSSRTMFALSRLKPPWD